MKKLSYILLAALTLAGCEKENPTRYDMSQGRVCFPGATAAERTEYPGYSAGDSTFYSSLSFRQQPGGAANAVISVPVKLIGSASGSTRRVGYRILDDRTTALPSHYRIVSAEVPAGAVYGSIEIEVGYADELNEEERTLILELTDSPDLATGAHIYLKANVSWHNMLPRPLTVQQWRTYNNFIDSTTSSNDSPEAYSQAAHQLLKTIFDWDELPAYDTSFSYYIDAWRTRARNEYDAWKTANPGRSFVHEAGTMKGLEVEIREP